MKYFRVALVILILAVGLAGSLLAISDQMATRASAAAGDGPSKQMKAAGGCGGGCGGGGGGMCAADQVKQAKKTLEAAGELACPKAAKGEKCDPKTCADCAKAVKAEGKPGATCAVHATAAKSAKPGEKTAATCPMTASKAAAASSCPVVGTAGRAATASVKATGTCPAMAEASGKNVRTDASEGKPAAGTCPYSKGAGDAKVAAGMPAGH
jgi:hypothetical protein